MKEQYLIPSGGFSFCSWNEETKRLELYNGMPLDMVIATFKFCEKRKYVPKVAETYNVKINKVYEFSFNYVPIPQQLQEEMFERKVINEDLSVKIKKIDTLTQIIIESSYSLMRLRELIETYGQGQGQGQVEIYANCDGKYYLIMAEFKEKEQ